MDPKPLDGVRVLDFTRLFAGPFCTMLLGDLGADVVKVEAPGGDPIRGQGPPFHAGQAMSFLAVNRNKRSLVLDLREAGNRDLAIRLAARADVVVENFRPGVMERLGLGHAAVAASNPRVIYASLSGMGADGPDKDKGAFDLTIQAEGGYMSITGERGGQPIKLGTSAFDLICGQYAMGAIVTALYGREQSGRGQRIETSLFESEISFLVDAGIEYLTTGRVRGKWGSEHAGQAPYKAFATADGWIVIGAGIQNLFEAFMGVLGRTDLLADPRFATLADRVVNRDALHAALDPEMRRHRTDDLVRRLTAADVPSAPVNDMAGVFAHPQALHRGMVRRVEHPDYGQVPQIGPAVKYGGFDVAADWRAPPLLGEGGAEAVARWLGEPGLDEPGTAGEGRAE